VPLNNIISHHKEHRNFRFCTSWFRSTTWFLYIVSVYEIWGSRGGEVSLPETCAKFEDSSFHNSLSDDCNKVRARKSRELDFWLSVLVKRPTRYTGRDAYTGPRQDFDQSMNEFYNTENTADTLLSISSAYSTCLTADFETFHLMSQNNIQSLLHNPRTERLIHPWHSSFYNEHDRRSRQEKRSWKVRKLQYSCADAQTSKEEHVIIYFTLSTNSEIIWTVIGDKGKVIMASYDLKLSRLLNATKSSRAISRVGI
jgi:hypothetical protein